MKLETRLFLTDLTHLDCAWFDPVHGLIGESWRVDVELGGELAGDGMLCDFGIVKSRLKQALDEHIDHRLLLDASQSEKLDTARDQAELSLNTSAGELYRYRAPQTSFALMDSAQLTPAALSAALQRRFMACLPDNISHLRFELHPAYERGAYRYCHGLRQHTGNCQRMAHGHRAQLEIRLHGERNPTLERQWQQGFNGRYIGSAEDLSTLGTRHRYAYQGSQGAFELELPEQRSCPIEAEPTIEHLTAHMARAIARDHPTATVECKAFEGIGKGAVSCVRPSPQCGTAKT